jgi:hypothetical protein
LFASLVVGENAPGGLIVGSVGAAPVTLFPSDTVNGWGGVIFRPQALPSTIQNTDFKHAGIALMGNVGGTGPAPVLQHVTIRGVHGTAVHLFGGGQFGAGSDSLTITGTTGSPGAPIMMYMSSVATVPTGRYTGNTFDAIWIQGTDIATDETWHDLGVPYYLQAGLPIEHASNPILTLDPGVVLQFAPGGILRAGGVAPGGLHAAGTAAQPIVLTGQYNFPGAWMGVEVAAQADPSTILDHVIVDYAGADDGQAAAGIRIAQDLGPIVRNTLIRNSGGCGITRLTGAAWSTDYTDPLLANTFQTNTGADQCGP